MLLCDARYGDGLEVAHEIRHVGRKVTVRRHRLRPTCVLAHMAQRTTELGARKFTKLHEREHAFVHVLVAHRLGEGGVAGNLFVRVLGQLFGGCVQIGSPGVGVGHLGDGLRLDHLDQAEGHDRADHRTRRVLVLAKDARAKVAHRRLELVGRDEADEGRQVVVVRRVGRECEVHDVGDEVVQVWSQEAPPLLEGGAALAMRLVVHDAEATQASLGGIGFQQECTVVHPHQQTPVSVTHEALQASLVLVDHTPDRHLGVVRVDAIGMDSGHVQALHDIFDAAHVVGDVVHTIVDAIDPDAVRLLHNLLLGELDAQHGRACEPCFGRLEGRGVYPSAAHGGRADGLVDCFSLTKYGRTSKRFL